jgi:ABC-type polysaccharide/polyol phosphate transport system ATPase subunit
MHEILDRAGTIVYVSHSMKSIREFCNRAIWLEHGRIASQGKARNVIKMYRASLAETEAT